MWEKSGSQVMAKMLLVSRISFFFNYQYLINGMTSDSNIMHVDRHE